MTVAICHLGVVLKFEIRLKKNKKRSKDLVAGKRFAETFTFYQRI